MTRATRTASLLVLLAVAPAAVLVLACQSQQREPVRYPEPQAAPPGYMANADIAPDADAYAYEEGWYPDVVSDSARVRLAAEPMPPVMGPHILMRLEIPAMLCVNCERAVVRLVESVPRTRVAAISHGTNYVHVLVPVTASSRVVRVLTTNGWRITEIVSDSEDAPFELAEPFAAEDGNGKTGMPPSQASEAETAEETETDADADADADSDVDVEQDLLGEE